MQHAWEDSTEGLSEGLSETCCMSLMHLRISLMHLLPQSKAYATHVVQASKSKGAMEAA